METGFGPQRKATDENDGIDPADGTGRHGRAYR